MILLKSSQKCKLEGFTSNYSNICICNYIHNSSKSYVGFVNFSRPSLKHALTVRARVFRLEYTKGHNSMQLPRYNGFIGYSASSGIQLPIQRLWLSSTKARCSRKEYRDMEKGMCSILDRACFIIWVRNHQQREDSPQHSASHSQWENAKH